MKKKVLLIICLLLLVTGCSSEYNLVIDDNVIKEEIVSTINDEDIPILSEEEKREGIELDDQITPFIKEDQYPFDDEQVKYEKKVYKRDGQTIVKLNYSYLYDDFINAKTYNCFEKHKISNIDGAIDLELGPGFYCLYGDTLNINVFTDKKVIETNADSVDGNKYTWVIDDSNVDDVSIVLKTAANQTMSNWVIGVIVFFLAFVAIDIFLYIQYKNKKDN